MMIKTKNRFYLFRSTKKESTLSFGTIFIVILFAMIGTFGFPTQFTHAAPIDIADTPLDVQLQASAPNIMFGLDDSVSMDFEILTNESTGGFGIVKDKDYEYVFDNPGDNAKENGVSADILTGDNRRYWKSQWSEYNMMYYNPAPDPNDPAVKITYKPWHSAMPNADPNTVRSHPMYDENYTNLNLTYFMLAPASAAVTIIKDDRDGSGISKTGNWILEDYPPVPTATPPRPGAYGGKDQYTTVDGPTFTWTPTIPSTAEYQVWVYNGFWTGNDQHAEYTIVHAKGTSIAYSDQFAKSDDWDLLGYYPFKTGTSGSVTVTRKDHPDKGLYTNADAVKFVKVDGIIVINAHYFVYSKTAGKPYLVNLNGSIKYYEYTDDGDNFIEPGELLADPNPPADIVTGRTYAEERQNFANWYSFYRKRYGVAVSAMCQSLEILEGIYVGIRSLNGNMVKRVHPIKVNGVDEKDILLNLLTSFRLSDYQEIGSTPARQGLERIGQYFSPLEADKEVELSVSPLDSGDGGGCQQNFAILFTDGAYNGLSAGMGNVDKDKPAPYGGKAAGTLADVAWYYWDIDLDGNANNNQVPTNFWDSNTRQHMVTYTIGFGVHGTLNPDDYDLFNPVVSMRKYPTWPDINTDPERIDDLWHAAVNGRGFFMNAQNPEELVTAFLTIIRDVMARIGSGAKVSINSEELNEGTAIFQSSYSTEFWSGDVKAYGIDPKTAEIKRADGEELWDASEKLAATDWNSGRVIATFNGVSGIPFRYASLSDSQKTSLSADAIIAGKMVNYLRGDRTYEGSPFRIRETILGDFVHSAPLYEEEVLYVGGNDGMLHAFNASKTTGGDELFAYIPGLVFSNLKHLADTGYAHKYYVDLSPFVRKVNNQTLLVGGLGKGGKGYFCLDVTDPLTITSEAILASRVKWEFPNPTTAAADVADMGYTYSRPVIVNTKAGWVVLFGNGYNSVNEHAVLYVLSTAGTLLAKIDTQSGPSNGLSTPAVIDKNSDMLADYVYVGDLLGNLWKFDIQAANPSAWKSAYESSPGVPAPLFTAKGPGGAVQAITSKPDIMFHCERHGYMVLFGTGKYLGSTDFGDTSTQTIYGIWDYGDDGDDTEYLGTFSRETAPNLSNQPVTVSLLEQGEFAFADYSGKYWGFTSDTMPNYGTEEDVSSVSGQTPNPINHAGWYFDLPLVKERLIQDMIIRDGYAIFLTNIPNASPCSAGGESILNEFKACTGQRPDKPRFDMDDDRDLTATDKQSRADCPDCEPGDDPLCPGCNKPIPPSRAHNPFMIYGPTILMAGDQELKIMSTASGGMVTQREPSEERGMFYWRAIKSE